MSRMRKRKTKVERSCASKRIKMNASATSWVTHGDETKFLQRQHDLEPRIRARISVTQERTVTNTSLYVRATHDQCIAHCTSQLNETKDVLPTSRISM